MSARVSWEARALGKKDLHNHYNRQMGKWKRKKEEKIRLIQYGLSAGLIRMAWNADRERLRRQKRMQRRKPKRPEIHI